MKKALFSLALLFPLLTYAQNSWVRLGRNSNQEVIEAMRPEEKDTLVIGSGWLKTDNGIVPLQGVVGITKPYPRYGITPVAFTDGPAGLNISPARKGETRTYYTTAFPTGSALAATWNTDLVRATGAAMGNEVLEYGSDVLLAPGINIQRNPLCGRNFEYYSEDPLLTGRMASAMVEGIQSQGVGSSIKHFVANNQERNRTMANSVVSQRALREIYLRGFEIAVREAKSQPWTIMVSYNKCNGEWTALNPELNLTVLREEWGFKGCVISDWGTGQSRESFRNGTDLLMPGTYDYRFSRELRKEGPEGEKALNRAVNNTLNLIKKTPRFWNYPCSDRPNLEANDKTALIGAEESIILLKNERHALPLKGGLRVALYGRMAYNAIAGGSGSGQVNNKHDVSLKEGLETCKYSTNNALATLYKQKIDSVFANYKHKEGTFYYDHYAVAYSPEFAISADQIRQQAQQTDVAVILIGRSAGEAWDREVDDYFNITPAELALLKTASKEFHKRGKKVIAVINTSGVIETASWEHYADAIVFSFLGGQESGLSIAEVLSGKVNPSGKLPTTIPMRYEDVPSAETFYGEPRTDTPDNYFYNEGIYVGYRYYDTFHKAVAYPFGYGLSYTRFSYSPLTVTGSMEELVVTLEVKNIGAKAGKEVVELYLSAPDVELEKPAQELKGFAKTRLLQPGESEKISIKLTPRLFASFDSASSSWVAEKGDYRILAGSSSRDIRQTATFTLPHSVTVEKVHNVLKPNLPLKEMTKSSSKVSAQ